MEFQELVDLVGELSCFDLPLLSQAFDVKRPVLRVQLSRWMTQGKIVGLRRGTYILSKTYRRVPLNMAVLANQLYTPSYLSGLWALGHYDMIPERVVWFTSVTSRVPRRFENPLGVFDYRNIKQAYFFGSTTRTVGDQPVLVAEPEKALLDHWHLTPGEWTESRLTEMRYQHGEIVSRERLTDYAARFDSPRLDRAVARWLKVTADEAEGWVPV
jgi:predicted transcriptional regulator of viral defense system